MRRFMNARGQSDLDDKADRPETETTGNETQRGAARNATRHRRELPSSALAPRPLSSIRVPDDVIPERSARELPPEFKEGISSEAIALVKPSTARANSILPFRFDASANALYIALGEEPDTARRQALDYTLNASARGLTLQFTRIPDEFLEHLARLIDNYYPPFSKSAYGASGGPGARTTESAKVASRYGFSQTLGLDERELHARAAGTPKDFVDFLLYKAAVAGASDVMIDRHEAHTRIKVMIDGRGYLFDEPMEGDVCEKSIRVIKNYCDIPTTRVRKPKGASFKSQAWIGGQLKKLRFRAEFTPAGDTDAATVRIHSGNEYLVDLDGLALDDRSREELAAIVDADQGLYPIVGRVGEGKSTTLHAVALRHNRVETPFASIQDPIEFEIEDVRGLDVREHGITFEEGLTSVLRWGMPKIILGEIRNPEVARIALEGARSGHLILTTFHAPDAVAAIARLTGDDGLGWMPGDVADMVPAVFAQRLLPKLCELCKQPVVHDEEELITAGFDVTLAADGAFFAPGSDGCGGCRNGIAGRVLIIETLRINNLVREILYENRHDTLQRDIRRAAIEDGLVPLRESALRAVARGEIWLRDALRKTQWHEGDLAIKSKRMRVYERHVEIANRSRELGAGSLENDSARRLGAGDPESTKELKPEGKPGDTPNVELGPSGPDAPTIDQDEQAPGEMDRCQEADDSDAEFIFSADDDDPDTTNRDLDQIESVYCTAD